MVEYDGNLANLIEMINYLAEWGESKRFTTCQYDVHSMRTIGLYRENAIAIQKESGDSNGGKVWYRAYVIMRITFSIPEFTLNERNSHCDVLHITPIRVARLVLDDAIAAMQTSR